MIAHPAPIVHRRRVKKAASAKNRLRPLFSPLRRAHTPLGGKPPCGKPRTCRSPFFRAGHGAAARQKMRLPVGRRPSVSDTAQASSMARKTLRPVLPHCARRSACLFSVMLHAPVLYRAQQGTSEQPEKLSYIRSPHRNGQIALPRPLQSSLRPGICSRRFFLYATPCLFTFQRDNERGNEVLPQRLLKPLSKADDFCTL